MSEDRRWLHLLMEALEDAHGDHDETCDCYERLRDGLSGVYRFPEVEHRVEDPPVYGCEDFMDCHMREMRESMERSFFCETQRMLTGYKIEAMRKRLE